MLAGWKSMHSDEQCLQKYIDLYAHIEDRNYVKRTEASCAARSTACAASSAESGPIAKGRLVAAIALAQNPLRSGYPGSGPCADVAWMQEEQAMRNVVACASRRPATRAVAALCALAALSLAGAAFAQPRHARPEPPPAWHGDIHRFPEHDWHVWRGGYWYHGPHAGRLGWWWVVGGAWYFYPAPVYPYPNPYEPPPSWIVSPPATSAPPAPPATFWYYCEAGNGYYPYVTTCPGGWRQVPATPAETSPAQPRAERP